MVVALHGVTHQQSSGAFRNIKNEFTGLSVEDSIALLTEGLKYLDMPTDSFIPPGNSYDFNLLVALDKLGFKRCFGTLPRVWLRRSPIPILHAYPPLYGRSREIKTLLFENKFPGESPSKQLKTILRILYYRSSIAAWERLYQCKSGKPTPNNVIPIAIHWTWEWELMQKDTSSLTELCASLLHNNVVSINDI